MLIDDAEIRERFPEEAEAIITALDLDPTTRAYQPIFNGKRFRPAVEKALEHRTKAAG